MSIVHMLLHVLKIAPKVMMTARNNIVIHMSTDIFSILILIVFISLRLSFGLD